MANKVSVSSKLEQAANLRSSRVRVKERKSYHQKTAGGAWCDRHVSDGGFFCFSCAWAIHRLWRFASHHSTSNKL